jgi:hypothetical protein
MTLSDLDIIEYQNKYRSISQKEISFEDARKQAISLYDLYLALYSKNCLNLGKYKINYKDKNMKIYDRTLAEALFSLKQELIGVNIYPELDEPVFVFSDKEETVEMVNKYDSGTLHVNIIKYERAKLELNKIIKNKEEIPTINI